ncbi:hypothetical protein Tco_1164074 [Tanacetum coccineum]
MVLRTNALFDHKMALLQCLDLSWCSSHLEAGGLTGEARSFGKKFPKTREVGPKLTVDFWGDKFLDWTGDDIVVTKKSRLLREAGITNPKWEFRVGEDTVATLDHNTEGGISTRGLYQSDPNCKVMVHFLILRVIHPFALNQSTTGYLKKHLPRIKGTRGVWSQNLQPQKSAEKVKIQQTLKEDLSFADSHCLEN